MSIKNLALWQNLNSLSAIEPFQALTQLFGEYGVGWGWNVTENNVTHSEGMSIAFVMANGWYRYNDEIIHCSGAIGCHKVNSFETKEDAIVIATKEAVLFSFSTIGLNISKHISA